jgi:DNA-binding MarR family transcriptional regulator
MHDACILSEVADRVEQLLGVVALAATDRFRSAMENELGAGGAAPAALVHLRAWPGGSVSELGDVLGLSQPAAVRLVERLVSRGLVRRDPGADGRTRALSCTPEGERLAEAMLAERAHSLRPLLKILEPEEREQLERLLGRVTAGLAEDRPSALLTCRLCDRGACQDDARCCPLNHTAPSA